MSSPRPYGWNKGVYTLGAALVLTVAGCTEAPKDPWERYTAAIDEHVESYIRFNEPDAATRTEIWQDYLRAKEIRAEYHRNGTIPRDPLVHEIFPGSNEFTVEQRHVAIVLAQIRSLECTTMTITKPAGMAGHFAVLGGNAGFWVDRDPQAKFISTTATVPLAENTLEISSQSYSPAKIIVAFAIGAVIGLSGCTPSDGEDEDDAEDEAAPLIDIPCIPAECPVGNDSAASGGDHCANPGRVCRINGEVGTCKQNRKVLQRMARCTCTCMLD